MAKVTSQNLREKNEREQAKQTHEIKEKLVAKQNENKGSLPNHGRFLADVNPAEKIHIGVPWQVASPLTPFDPNGDVLTRLLDLENNACGILYSLNNASISATCNTDNTITITLNLPSLPAVC